MHTLVPADALAAARRGVVAVARPDLAVLPLGGADVLRYLHAVCTQHTAGRAGGGGRSRPALAVLPLAGADVLRYLHAVCTQHTDALAAGDAAEALLLSPKGK